MMIILSYNFNLTNKRYIQMLIFFEIFPIERERMLWINTLFILDKINNQKRKLNNQTHHSNCSYLLYFWKIVIILVLSFFRLRHTSLN